MMNEWCTVEFVVVSAKEGMLVPVLPTFTIEAIVLTWYDRKQPMTSY